jgi:hypothetical protein
MSARRLGKKLGVVHDPRTITAASVLRFEAIQPPSTHGVSAGALRSVPMFANDRYGDCTYASQGHRIVTQEKSARQREIQLTDEDILTAYSAITGFDPADPSTDNGAYELDVLNYMRRVGMGRERDGTPHTIGAFVKVDHLDHAEVMRAHYVFGGLKVCAALPISAQDQEVWDVTTGADAEFGSWGGHSMYSSGYSPRGVGVWTWGEYKRMTWAWFDRYVDECYALISEDYLRAGGTTPQGFDRAALERQLAELR